MIFQLGEWYHKNKLWILENTDIMDFIEQSEWRKFNNYYDWKIQKEMYKN